MGESMTLTLRILAAQPLDGDELALCFDAPRIVIGRAAGCDLVLPSPTVSARHASLRHRGAEYVIVDEGSTNGILVGSVKLPSQTPRVVRDGEILRIGRVWLEVLLGVGVPSAPRQAEALALRLVREQLRADREDVRPTVRVVAGPDEGQCYLLEADHEVVVGRSHQCDWALCDERLSRRHVSICHRGGEVWAHDLGSKRGAELDGVSLGPQETSWRPGQRLTIGGDELVLVDPAPEALQELQRAPDERMRPSEFAEPPPGAAADELQQVVQAPDEAAADLEAGEGQPDESDEPPDDREAPEAHREGHIVEVVIVLVALAVLAASAAGLFWLLRP